MIPLYSTSQIRETDKYAIEVLGMPGILLMENASLELFGIISEQLKKLNISGRVGIVCGKGNNGGDGFALARHFANHGIPVTVIHTGEAGEMSGDCSLNFGILKKISGLNKNLSLKKYRNLRSLVELKKCNIVIDAMLGSGGIGELKSPYKEIVGYLNKLRKYKVSVDIPTGLDADKGYAEDKLKVDLTVTLGELKKGLFFSDGYELSKEIKKGGIGVDPGLYSRYKINEYLIEPEDAFNYLPEKGKGINKYSSGKVLTIAGSGKYPGAAVMTSKGVLKAGAGASVLAFPLSASGFIHKNITEVVVEHYNDGNKGYLAEKNIIDLEKRIEWADVVSAGPGLGRNEATQNALKKLLSTRKFKKLVIDADGLFPFNYKEYLNYNTKNIVFTPHMGEFSSLIGIYISKIKKDVLAYGKEFVQETNSYLVLKGAPTIIFYKEEVFINTAGNPGMAKFGTGDVLTGIISGFLAQQEDILKSLVCAVYLHSITADLLKTQYTEYGYTAENILEYFPRGIKFIKDTFAIQSR
ncbi:MAG: NAD(P)H-hydrate dehydratase [Ignavibacteriales bacterium]|nr:MAG: NAD(P)H-hydrate dehydratase [Ignavibacteriales bacterium]